MLDRIEASDGFVAYRSPRLHAAGVPHLFSTRRGGRDVGELDVALAEDAGLARIRRELDAGSKPLLALRQVHGARLRSEAADYASSLTEWPEGDAVTSTASNSLAVVRTADCVPVLLAAADGTRVAAAHAGWRGLVHGVLENTVAAFDNPAQAVAAIGPCLGPGRFEVGPEVADAFAAAGLAAAVLPPGAADGRPHVDLRKAAVLALTRAGIESIDVGTACTWELDELYSYRRDVTHGGRPRTGRLGAFIAPRPAGA